MRSEAKFTYQRLLLMKDEVIKQFLLIQTTVRRKFCIDLKIKLAFTESNAFFRGVIRSNYLQLFGNYLQRFFGNHILFSFEK